MYPISNHNFIDRLPEHIQASVKSRMKKINFADGECIYRTGDEPDSLYQVVSGQIKISNVSHTGREALYLVFEEGDCFGEISLIDDKPRGTTATAVGDTVVAALKKADYDELHHLHTEFSDHVAATLCHKLRWVFGLFEGSTLLPLPQRLAARLIQLVDAHGKEAEQGFLLDISLSQKDIGHMLGASRQAVGKILTEWQDLGFVEIHYGKMTVKDLSTLQAIANEG